MMSAPSSSFHDYLAMDSCLPKMEAMTPIQTMDDPLEENFDDINQAHHRTSKTSAIKRPMNAFLLWARGERKRVSSDGYGVSQTSLSKLLGETWRHMSVEEKQPFLDMAETLKRQHHLDHPDYKFKPKQRSSNGNKISTNKRISSSSSFIPQQQLSSPSVPTHCTSSSSSSSSFSQLSLSPTANATPHPIQSNVLAMCQAIIPPSENPHDWFYQLTGQPQSVIIAPLPRIQTSPMSSRRAVRIQIINKHDDIVLPPPTLLPMTPPPPTTLSSSSTRMIDESTPTMADYYVNNCNMFHIPTTNHHHHHHHHHHQVLAQVIDDQTEYETLPDTSVNHLTDLDQHYDSSGWIDTPLSNFGTNSTDMVSSSPYSSYDFLCL